MRRCDEGICVRGHRIRLLGRMRVDANGDVYAPDSDEEKSGMEVKASGLEMVDLGGASGPANGIQMAFVGVPTDAIEVDADGIAGDGSDVVAEGVPVDAVELPAGGGATDGVKVAADVAGTSKEMHPVVAARLKMLLAHMDPTFHDVFVNH